MLSHLLNTYGTYYLGLVIDRDSMRWGLSPKMVQRRRIIFWDLFVADAFQVSFCSNFVFLVLICTELEYRASTLVLQGLYRLRLP